MLKPLLGAAALLASFAIPSALGLSTISVKGAKLFAGGQQFFIKGVAYQGTPADPLVDTNQCLLDAKSMQSIGTNSIRVYHVDADVSHDGCMTAFSNARIYVWLDLDTFDTQIEQTSPTWTENQMLRFAAVMDAFQKYDNLAGFWIGNEVINTLAGSPAAPYIKAATSDMKSYMAAKGYRQIPIGYSAADIAELRPMLQNYLACGGNPAQSIDFFGLNSYEWCGSATYQTSGYSNLQAMALGYNLPMFFSETGCIVGGERTFSDQAAIFGSEMVDTWSGSIIYEWVQEANGYGIVNYPNGQIYSGAPIPIQPDFDNLSNVWKSISPTGVAEGSYTPSYSAPACPSSTGGWVINGNVPLPTLSPSVITQAAGGKIKPSSTSAGAVLLPTQTDEAAVVTTGGSITTSSGTLLSFGSVVVSSCYSSSFALVTPAPTSFSVHSDTFEENEGFVFRVQSMVVGADDLETEDVPGFTHAGRMSAGRGLGVEFEGVLEKVGAKGKGSGDERGGMDVPLSVNGGKLDVSTTEAKTTDTWLLPPILASKANPFTNQSSCDTTNNFCEGFKYPTRTYITTTSRETPTIVHSSSTYTSWSSFPWGGGSYVTSVSRYPLPTADVAVLAAAMVTRSPISRRDGLDYTPSTRTVWSTGQFGHYSSGTHVFQDDAEAMMNTAEARVTGSPSPVDVDFLEYTPTTHVVWSTGEFGHYSSGTHVFRDESLVATAEAMATGSFSPRGVDVPQYTPTTHVVWSTGEFGHYSSGTHVFRDGVLVTEKASPTGTTTHPWYPTQTSSYLGDSAIPTLAWAFPTSLKYNPTEPIVYKPTTAPSRYTPTTRIVWSPDHSRSMGWHTFFWRSAFPSTSTTETSPATITTPSSPTSHPYTPRARSTNTLWMTDSHGKHTWHTYVYRTAFPSPTNQTSHIIPFPTSFSISVSLSFKMEQTSSSSPSSSAYSNLASVVSTSSPASTAMTTTSRTSASTSLSTVESSLSTKVSSSSASSTTVNSAALGSLASVFKTSTVTKTSSSETNPSAGSSGTTTSSSSTSGTGTAAAAAAAATTSKSSAAAGPMGSMRNPIVGIHFLADFFGVGGELGVIVTVAIVPVLVAGFL